MANSADPDETLCSVASHLGLHCLLKYAGLSVPIHMVNTVRDNQNKTSQIIFKIR